MKENRLVCPPPPHTYFRLAKGFTLIELLVVVLIIGILAAIALPQYRKTVEKSRAAEALANARTLSESVKRYILETGAMPTSFDNLDIAPPAAEIIAQQTGYDVRANKNFFYVLQGPEREVAVRKRMSATDTNWAYNPFAITYKFDQDTRSTSPIVSKDSLLCGVRIADPNAAFYESICKSLGGSDANSITLSGYLAYKLN